MKNNQIDMIHNLGAATVSSHGPESAPHSYVQMHGRGPYILVVVYDDEAHRSDPKQPRTHNMLFIMTLFKVGFVKTIFQKLSKSENLPFL